MVPQPQFVCLSHKLNDLYDDAKRETTPLHEEWCTGFKTNLEILHKFDEDKYKNVCKITVHYITDLKTKGLNIVHGCIYLYNRLSDDLIKTVKIRTDAFTFYKALLNEFCSNLECPEIFTNNIEHFSKPVFENHKHLVDLYKNLQKINSSAKCDEADAFVRLYMDKMKECIGVTDDDFCDELDRFKKRLRNCYAEQIMC